MSNFINTVRSGIRNWRANADWKFGWRRSVQDGKRPKNLTPTPVCRAVVAGRLTGQAVPIGLTGLLPGLPSFLDSFPQPVEDLAAGPDCFPRIWSFEARPNELFCANPWRREPPNDCQDSRKDAGRVTGRFAASLSKAVWNTIQIISARLQLMEAAFRPWRALVVTRTGGAAHFHVSFGELGALFQFSLGFFDAQIRQPPATRVGEIRHFELHELPATTPFGLC